MRSSDYAVVRDFVFERDGHRCVYCGQPATELDHIQPESAGGPFRPMNLNSVCRTCNQRKGDRATHGTDVPDLVSDQPKCSHCTWATANPRSKGGKLCRACDTYRYRNGVLPPQRILDRRLDRQVAKTNRGDLADWTGSKLYMRKLPR